MFLNLRGSNSWRCVKILSRIGNRAILTRKLFEFFFHRPLPLWQQIARIPIGKGVRLPKEKVFPFSPSLLQAYQTHITDTLDILTSSLTTASLFESTAMFLTFSTTWRTKTDNLSLYPFIVMNRPAAWGEKLYDSPARSASYANSVNESLTRSEKSLESTINSVITMCWALKTYRVSTTERADALATELKNTEFDYDHIKILRVIPS